MPRRSKTVRSRVKSSKVRQNPVHSRLQIERLESRRMLAYEVQPIFDINSEPQPGVNPQPAEFTEFAGQTFFVASTAEHGRELWKTDGTEAGTQLVADIRVGSYSSYPAELTVVGNTLYFSADLGFGRGGRELWHSDGTAEGTAVLEIDSSYFGSSNPSYLTNVDGVLFFVANDGTGREIWTSDGTQAGTRMVRDINPGNHYPGG